MHHSQPSESSLLLQLLSALGAVAHNIQLERGRSSLFIVSSEDLFRAEMCKQHTTTDESIAAFRHLASDSRTQQTLDAAQIKILQNLVISLKGLAALRQGTLQKKVTFSQAINDYTYKYSMLTIDALLELARLNPKTNPGSVSALNKFLQWKERTGRQRALGVRGFHTEGPEQTEFLDRMEALLVEQDAFYQAYVNLASEDQKNLIKGFLDNIRKEELGHLTNIQDSTKTTDVSVWFQLMTRKIDLMRETEIALLDTLLSKQGTPASITPSTERSTNNAAKPSKAILRTIPLFKDLGESALDHLIQQAHIRHYPRGKLLIQQGEPTMRIYVILHGWVKIFNSTSSGEESILQMLSSGDTVLETSAILDSPSPYSAQVAEDANMISFPAPIIRQSVRNNQDLSFSIINNISLRSQQLIHQIEQSRLASAEERVGWFLLRLMLESGNADTHINIPYEKALAAAYLDMRPETFSRILKKFKQQGFDIQNDKIVLPHNKALCHYCRQSTAALCERHNSPDCPLRESA